MKNPPSPIGCWAYEQPKDDDVQPCKNTQSWLRWDFDWLQPFFAFAEIDPERTKVLLNELSDSPNIQKLFLEPHLKARLHLNSSKIRFQGCQAARHDDHIHLQIPASFMLGGDWQIPIVIPVGFGNPTGADEGCPNPLSFFTSPKKIRTGAVVQKCLRVMGSEHTA